MEKKAVIFSGAPAAGKSTKGEQMSMIYGADAIVCPDTIREMCGAIDRDENGEPIAISQELNAVVFQIFYKIVEARMSRGVPVVCDGTFVDRKSLKQLKLLSEKYGYSVELHRFECSLETLLERNKHRGYKNVPDYVVKNMYERFQNFEAEDWYTLVVHNTEG